MNKGTLLILIWSLSLVSTAGGEPFPQSKTNTEVPTLEQIFDKYVQALGGRASVEKVNIRTSKGTFTSTHLKTKGPIELYAKQMQTIQAPIDIEAGGEYKRRIGRLKSLQLGHFIIENPTVSLSENVDGEGGLIGEEILRRFKVIFDFSHHRMILTPNSHFKEPYEEDMSGISVTPEENSGTKVFRIRQVVANTPGFEAGLHADDLITAVDGQPASSLTEGHLEHLFMQEGREVALTIRRSEKQVQVRLKLRRLI